MLKLRDSLGWMLGQKRLRRIAAVLVAVVLIAMAILFAKPVVSGNRQALWVAKALLSPVLRDSLQRFRSDVLKGSNDTMSVLSMVIVGNDSEAGTALSRLLASNPSDEQIHFLAFRLPRIGAHLEDPATAEGAFTLATKIAPNDALIWYEQASFYETHGQIDKALAAYREGYQVDPRQAANGYLRSGMIYYRLGKYPEALDLLDQSAVADTNLPQLPDWARGMLYFYIGDSQRRLQNWEASLAAFDRVLSVSQLDGWPRYAAYVGIGDIWLAKGNMEQSRRAYESALRSAGIDVNRSVVYKALGALYRQAGEKDQAVAAYQQAVQLNPQDPWAHADLGQVYEQLRQLDQAAEQYREALRIDPEMTSVQEALNNLGTGNASNK